LIQSIKKLGANAPDVFTLKNWEILLDFVFGNPYAIVVPFCFFLADKLVVDVLAQGFFKKLAFLGVLYGFL
jgi:hypothetical protein